MRSALELRERGYDGELTVLGAEPHRPYDRPPLSKSVLAGGDPIPLELDPDLDVRLGVTATALRPGRLATTAGELRYDGLVLAVGAVPLRLPGDTGTVVLRTLDDALALRAALGAGRSLIVVGAGWIGAEVASVAAAAGTDVTVVEAADAPLTAALGAEIGALTTDWYAAAGVRLRTGARVVAVDATSVTLADGTHLAADVVVSGLGVRPDVDWLAGSGLELGRGVRTDAHLATALPGVVAAGDCAEVWSDRRGDWLSLQHWDDALHSPAVAAATLLGEPATYDPVPYVWSEQFGHYLQYVGWRSGRAIWRRDEAGWSVAWLDGDGRLVGLLAVDRRREAMAARKLIAGGHRPDPARLADPAVPLRRS